MDQPGQLLVVRRHPDLDGIRVRPGVHQPPHRVGRLLGRLRRGAGAHLVHERQLEALDLLLRRAVSEGREGCSGEVVLPGALHHREAIPKCDCVRHPTGDDTRTGSGRGTVSCSCVSIFRRLLGFLKPYRAGAVWSLVLAALAMVATVAIPWLTGQAIDALKRGDESELRRYAVRVAVAAILRLGLSVARRLVAGRVSLAIEFDLRNLFYRHLQSLELAFFD